MKPLFISSLAVSLTLLAACTSEAGYPEAGTEDPAAASGSVKVDLRLRDDPEGAYRSVDEFTVPATHEIGDGMFPYEGIGWENGLVGYRLYLDGRLVSDIFGKQGADPVLGQIGELGSYHDLAPWGMDVLKVGPSLGIGGLGIMRGDAPAQFGSVPELSARISESGGDAGRFTITAGGIDVGEGASGGFTADYSIGAQSPLTRVSVNASDTLPLATGIVMHDGAEFIRSAGASSGDWQYIATWGDTQSENGDGLGMALFYRADQAGYGGLANETHFVTFDDAEFEYGFLAAWALDPMAITDRDGFVALLEEELTKLEGSAQ
ncbi:DUF4861 family protein [Aurantiacibacter marinus]|uniref:DUF4861 family protein n=1 Tax=Aurantiacibacter marinus TaxID=874156 RepID=UPI000ACC1129|nr:DUF4861 family protein [Aurantiacibacter marinus]